MAGHPRVAEVNYPGLPENIAYLIAKEQFGDRFGGLLTIRLGSKEQCFQLIKHLKVIKNLANLGDAKTLIIHPSSTIYCTCTEAEQIAAGVYPDLLRVSVGIESIRDIINDFEQAFAQL